MKYNELGNSGIKVSALCLGTMTWGTQTGEADAHAQIETSLDHGVNFIDTDEMYPTNPLSQETQGTTEEILGNWLHKSNRRDDVVIATKITGAGNGNVRGRNGAPINPETIREAIEASLKRLKTDYIDLYQFHWPNRGSYHFRKHWDFDASSHDPVKTRDDILQSLRTMDELIKEGKVRAFGTSNESCWGTSQYLEIAKHENLPRMVSIQNEYSLICRMFDLDLGELCVNENVGLLAFSPLAAGLLTGKYQGDVIPEGSRRTFSNDLGGRLTPRSLSAVDEYVKIAEKHGLDVTQMSLAWCMTRPFMASVIFGATRHDQLPNILKSSDITLGEEVMSDIQTAYRNHGLTM